MQIHDPSFVAAERSNSTLNPGKTVNSSAGVALPPAASARRAPRKQTEEMKTKKRIRAGCKYFVSNAKAFPNPPNLYSKKASPLKKSQSTGGPISKYLPLPLRIRACPEPCAKNAKPKQSEPVSEKTEKRKASIMYDELMNATRAKQSPKAQHSRNSQLATPPGEAARL
jgi:hypothetical protein